MVKDSTLEVSVLLGALVGVFIVWAMLRGGDEDAYMRRCEAQRSQEDCARLWQAKDR